VAREAMLVLRQEKVTTAAPSLGEVHQIFFPVSPAARKASGEYRYKEGQLLCHFGEVALSSSRTSIRHR
jgi:hypothetical protein